MLSKRKSMEKLVTAVIFTFLLGTSSVARAQEDFEAMASMVNLMDGFLGLMDSVYDMNADNEKAILLQMHALEEIYKEQGKHDEAVRMYRRVLDNSKNATVRNMAYHRMADVLKEAGDMQTAVEVLNAAMAETLKRTK